MTRDSDCCDLSIGHAYCSTRRRQPLFTRFQITNPPVLQPFPSSKITANTTAFPLTENMKFRYLSTLEPTIYPQHNLRQQTLRSSKRQACHRIRRRRSRQIDAGNDVPHPLKKCGIHMISTSLLPSAFRFSKHQCFDSSQIHTSPRIHFHSPLTKA